MEILFCHVAQKRFYWLQNLVPLLSNLSIEFVPMLKITDVIGLAAVFMVGPVEAVNKETGILEKGWVSIQVISMELAGSVIDHYVGAVANRVGRKVKA